MNDVQKAEQLCWQQHRIPDVWLVRCTTRVGALPHTIAHWLQAYMYHRQVESNSLYWCEAV